MAHDMFNSRPNQGGKEKVGEVGGKKGSEWWECWGFGDRSTISVCVGVCMFLVVISVFLLSVFVCMSGACKRGKNTK